MNKQPVSELAPKIEITTSVSWPDLIDAVSVFANRLCLLRPGTLSRLDADRLEAIAWAIRARLDS